MNAIITFLVSSLLLYGYWILFVAMLASAIIVPFPVSTLLLAAGAFASQGYFSLATVIVVVVSANMLGDCFDFFLARKYGRPVLEMMHVKIPDYFERLEKFVGKHPGPAIFITRFVGTIEPLTSLLCGFIGVRFSTFFFYALIGDIVSDGMVIYAGYMLGTHWQSFIGLFNITGLVLFLIVIAIVFIVIKWHNKRNSNILGL